MLKTIYFGLVDGGIITQYQLSIAARIKGIELDLFDEKAVRNFAGTCPGISKEIKQPSIRYLLTHGDKIMATKRYHELNRDKGIGIGEAKKYIDSLELSLKGKSNAKN